MADLFLDIRDRHIRAIVSDNGEARLQRAYPLRVPDRAQHTRGGHPAENPALGEGELADIIATIRNDAGITLDQAHLILPSADIQRDIHRLPRMPQQDALKLVTRKTAEKTGDEIPQIGLIPMAIDQNSQEWCVEYVPTDTLRTYKKECAAAKLKLQTVTTALDSTLYAIAHLRESIFNAHAVFEINATSIEAYYVSASNLLMHETLAINEDEDLASSQDAERSQKRRTFAILDLLYHVNSQFQTAHPMTPLQKVWLCGTDPTISELSSVLQDAMDVETGLLADNEDASFIALKGFWKACQGDLVTNFMHPDLLRRFPLRKRSGMLLYIATVLLVAFFVITAEYRHNRLTKQVVKAKKELAALKASQTASANFAKNLDLLKKLSGSQVMFYPIFRDLAMNLPDGIYLDSFNYLSKDNRNTIDISATFLQASDLGAQKNLTKIIELLNQSPYLKHYSEPSITSTTRDLKKVMTVNFSCEVNPLDTAK